MGMGMSEVLIGKIEIAAFTIPTDAPEADGTLAWDSTTLVLAEIQAGGQTGTGYTYAHAAAASMAKHLAETCLQGKHAFDIPALHAAMLGKVRNNGQQGICAMAISALDVALWDLKARLLDVPLAKLLGQRRSSVEAYGSGGFTSYSNDQLRAQLGGWAGAGLRSVKMKIGSEPEQDPHRVRVAREAIGPDTELFVDANGAYSTRQAIAMANSFAEQGVVWFEEPVSSDYLAEMSRVRTAVSSRMDIAAGEYGYDARYFRHILHAGAVDVLQMDATRCLGFTGFLQGAAIAASFGCPTSAHCAPSLHMHVGCSVEGFRNVEYFHDHVRIEQMLFDGFEPQRDGRLTPDLSAPGMGLTFKHKDAKQYAV
uniref:Mandelate racemase n=1 Tax=Acidobacterium capsulatum TaxID=33075 RepID=A0A7V4XQ51_9BACT